MDISYKKSAIGRITLLFIGFTSLWVFLLELAPDGGAGAIAWLHTNQGLAMVLFGGLLIFLLLRMELRGQPGGGSTAAVGRELPSRARSDKKLVELVSAYDTTIERWAQALELRNHEPENHCQRVTEMTLELGRALGIPEVELADIRRGAYLHDIGKMATPDSILLKNGPLTVEERAVMERHTEVASRLLAGIPYLERAMDIPHHHHEKWDGSGYPQGLEGEAIPLAARIFAVVDVWDALTSDRPYRRALPHRAALTYIRSQAGLHFDPKVVEAFLRLDNIATWNTQQKG